MLDALTDSLNGFRLGEPQAQREKVGESSSQEVSGLDEMMNQFSMCSVDTPEHTVVSTNPPIVPMTLPVVIPTPPVTPTPPVEPPIPPVVPVVITLSDSESDTDEENAIPKSPIPLIVISDSESESDDDQQEAVKDDSGLIYKKLVKEIFGSEVESSDDDSDSDDESSDDDSEDEFFDARQDCDDDDDDFEMTNNIVEMIQTIRRKVDIEQDGGYVADDDEDNNVVMRSQSPEIITRPGKFELRNEDSCDSTATVGYNVNMDWETGVQPNPTPSTSQQPKPSETHKFPVVKFEQSSFRIEKYEPPVCSMSAESLESYESMMIDEPYYTRNEYHDISDNDIDSFKIASHKALGNMAAMDRGDFENLKTQNILLENIQSRPTTLFEHPEASKELSATIPSPFYGNLPINPIGNIDFKEFNTMGTTTSQLSEIVPSSSLIGNTDDIKDFTGPKQLARDNPVDDSNKSNNSALITVVNKNIKEENSEMPNPSSAVKQPNPETLLETPRTLKKASPTIVPKDPRLSLIHKVCQKQTCVPITIASKGHKRALDDDCEEYIIEPSVKKLRSNSWSQHSSKSFYEFCHQWMSISQPKDVTTASQPGCKRKYMLTVHEVADGASPSKRSRH
ncbi:unnamed protein product [Owenia fusiformis]|uniref:Uncharacterized protein n=1 Tax=Owenia fusiformis TaxID=6347 RepID=A0A8J1XVS8_OWEFU|nr:unnamed protein product [Owenia fusiformis]